MHTGIQNCVSGRRLTREKVSLKISALGSHIEKRGGGMGRTSRPHLGDIFVPDASVFQEQRLSPKNLCSKGLISVVH